MKIIFCFFTLLFVLINFLVAGVPDSEEIDEAIHRGIQATISQKYELAIGKFDSLKRILQEDPRPYFYHAAALQARMLDFENYIKEEQFLHLIEKSVQIAEEYTGNHQDRAMGYFYKGAAISYRGFYHAQRKNYINGIRDAIVGVKYLKKALQIDSTYYDAYLGLGSYKYWRSRLTKFVSWLPFFPDQREQGIAMVKKAIRHSRYGRDVAINSLIWIEIDQKHYQEAVRLTREMLKKYPHSRYFIWPLAETYFRSAQFDKAIHEYRRLLKSYQKEPHNSHYNEVACGLKIAQAWQELEGWEQARKIASKTLDIQLEDNIRKRLKDKRQQLKNIIEHCKEMKSKEVSGS